MGSNLVFEFYDQYRKYSCIMSNGNGEVIIPRDDKHLEELASSEGPVVMDFSAVWCGPCRRIEPLFKQLARTNPEVKFVKVDVDEYADFAEDMGVAAMPTFQFREDGETINALTVQGASNEKLEANLEALLLGNYPNNVNNDAGDEGSEPENTDQDADDDF